MRFCSFSSFIIEPKPLTEPILSKSTPYSSAPLIQIVILFSPIRLFAYKFKPFSSPSSTPFVKFVTLAFRICAISFAAFSLLLYILPAILITKPLASFCGL